MMGVPRKRLWFAAIIGLAVFYYTLKHADVNKLSQNAQNIDIFWGMSTVVASALSYLCIAAVLHRLLSGIGRHLPFRSTFKISLLSCTLNYLMALGGLSGVAAKVYLLAREKIPPSNTLSISMIHGFLTNTVAVLFIYLGFFFLYSEYKMNTRQMEVGAVILGVAFLLTWLTIQTIVHESFRKKLAQLILRVSLAVCSRLGRPTWVSRERAEAFLENFNDGMNLLTKHTGTLLAPATLALLDWLFMFLCLKCAFEAVHCPIDNQSLLVGFSVGIFATLFSLTPASIGLMEGSMAGSFYLMGVDYDCALLATLLYRFAYFFLPILISTLFYKHFFPRSSEKAETEENNNASDPD